MQARVCGHRAGLQQFRDVMCTVSAEGVCTSSFCRCDHFGLGWRRCSPSPSATSGKHKVDKLRAEKEEMAVADTPTAMGDEKMAQISNSCRGNQGAFASAVPDAGAPTKCYFYISRGFVRSCRDR